MTRPDPRGDGLAVVVDLPHPATQEDIAHCEAVVRVEILALLVRGFAWTVWKR
jgi:hypothetical protein